MADRFGNDILAELSLQATAARELARDAEGQPGGFYGARSMGDILKGR